ncbi:MAG: HAMP domain-containing sensor histidine kinase [Desulfobacula sp.]|jgi:two-component system OmpR family sensor kinase|nr:HAMP domain-containing sensor histidine kinase [Desulfobacula sp.]
MTVRKKIALLITGAGFLSSLIFSCIILWEVIEQPFRIIDSELEAVSQRTVPIVSKGETSWKKGDIIPDEPLFVGDDRYWLKIYDQAAGKLIYQSHLAELVKIKEPAPGSSATESVIIPRNKIDLRQDRQNEVTFRVKSFIISLDGKTFLVCAACPMEKLEEELWDIFIGVVSGLAFSVLVLMAISYFVAGYILKPVQVMNDQVRDITEKHLDRRIPVGADPDEFNTLARTLNQVFERLQHAFIRQKQLLADASHELKTPLTMMRLALDETRSSQDEKFSSLQTQNLAWLTEQVLRMERLVKNLLDLSSLEIKDVIAKDPVDVAKLLTSLIEDYRFLTDLRNIKISVSLPWQLLTEGNAEKLNRAFSNILDNAIKYNVEEGRVEVVGEQSEGGLTIMVSNTGPGVAETEIGKVFDQFYRVEQSRALQHGGAGLGLAIVKRIIELHNGQIKFESKPGDWTRVIVSLPHST